MAKQGGSNDIERVSEDQFREHLKETYANPDQATKFFEEQVEARKRTLQDFVGELNEDEHRMKEFTRSPLEALNKRKLLGPLDRISIDDLINPFFDWPWPWPICRIVCELVAELETEWVCISIWPFGRICWPILVIRLRWRCRIVCD
jgi:rubrerythrin